MQKIIVRRQPKLNWEDTDSDLPPLLQRVYANRGVSGRTALDHHLRQLLPPTQLKGLSEAVTLLADAVMSQKRVTVVGDFDADGATSSALAVLALRAMGLRDVEYLVPNRFEYGYGLTPEIVDEAVRRQPQMPEVIVTVDNGISSIDGVARARQLGMQVVVTDHHLQGAELPAADAVVNPNQQGCPFPSKNLAGVGVIFYVMGALRTELRQRGWFDQLGIAEPNMAGYLDIVALGTVADVVPLDANNRILVYQGLQRIRAGAARPGILALLEVAGRQRQRLVASDLGFTVAPRLNAAGRLDDMSLGIECLLCENPQIAREMAIELDDLNRDRRAIETTMQQEALRTLDKVQLDEAGLPWGLCLYDSQWHQGVIGILASRIKDRYHRPVIAFADADNGAEVKGSARSIPGLHIRDALDAVAAANPGLLSKFGGHAMAAGMTLPKANYAEFIQAFDAVVRRSLDESDLQASILSDGCLEPQDLSLDVAHALREGGPWGQHFPEPVFDGRFVVVQQRLVGEKHLKLVLALEAGSQQLIDAIAFNVDLSCWPNPAVTLVDLAYRLDVNEFRGQRTVQLMVDYIQPANVAVAG